jgi:hypothetical protein
MRDWNIALSTHLKNWGYENGAGATKITSILDSLKGITVSLSDIEMDLLNQSLPEDSPLDAELVDQPPFIG